MGRWTSYSWDSFYDLFHDPVRFSPGMQGRLNIKTNKYYKMYLHATKKE